METSFSEIRSKLVVNIVDGKKLGHIIDIVFDQNSAKILGFVVPGHKSFLSIFKTKEDIFIPYGCICKIGSDTILVQLSGVFSQNSKQENTNFYGGLSLPQNKK